MIRCQNCSSILPELESQGLTHCPQCHCELAPTGLPPLPGFDLETAAPTQRSPTIFGLTSVGHPGNPENPNPAELGLENLPHPPLSSPGQKASAPLPGLPGVDDALSLPSIPLKPSAPSAGLNGPKHHVIDFSQSNDLNLPSVGDLPDAPSDLPGLSSGGASLPGLPSSAPSPGVNLPNLAGDLPSPTLDLPSPAVDLPAISESLPAVSSTLPSPLGAGRPVAKLAPPPPPPGSSRSQKPAPPLKMSAPRAQNVGKAVPMSRSPLASSTGGSSQASSRSRLKQALARHAPEKEDFLPGIEELDLGLDPAPKPAPAPAPAAAANTAAVLPEDLPETVAALDLSELSMPYESLPVSVPNPTHAGIGESPAPKPVVDERPRWPLFAGASVLVLALAGAASWQFGLLSDFGFGPQDDTSSQSASLTPAPIQANEPKKADLVEVAAKDLKPRSEPFVKAMFADTPLIAKTLANAEKDPLGELEADLYFALQNPEPKSWNDPKLKAAAKALNRWQSNPAHYVQRVVGLYQTYLGRFDLAEKTLAKAAATPEGGKDDLISLYRAQLNHAKQEPLKGIKRIRGLALKAPALKRAGLLADAWSQGLPVAAGVKANVAAWEGHVAQAVNGDAPASSAFTVALTLLDRGEWAKVRKIADQYQPKAKIEQDQLRWKILSAKVMKLQGNPMAANTTLREVLEKNPHELQAAYQLWQNLYDAGQYDKLNSELSSWLLTHPQDMHARIMQAKSLGALGDGSVALLLLAQLDKSLLTGAKLGPALNTSSPDGALKDLRKRSNSLSPKALIAIAPGLAKVSPDKRGFAAASALARAEILARRMAVKGANTAAGIAQALEPLNEAPPILRSNMMAKAGQFPRAMATLEEAISRVASMPHAQANRLHAKWLAHQSQLARQAGKTKIARRKLAQAQAVDPSNPYIELDRAKLQFQHGKEEQAQARFAALAHRVGDMPGLMNPLAQIYLRQGKLEKLEAMIAPKLQDANASIDLLISGARLRIAQEQLMPALALAKRALDQAPQNWEAHLVKAQVLVARGDLDGALSELKEFKPQEANPTYELWLGKIKDAQGDLESAYGHYRLASSLDKSSAEPRVLQAKILARRGNAKKAISMLKPLMRHKALNADVFLAMGIAHRDLRKPKKAISFFKRAQAKSPNSYIAFYEEGRIASNHNDHTQVIRSMDRALSANSPAMPPRTRLDALRRLGRAYVETNDSTRAEEILSRYLIEAPRDDPGRGAVMRMMDAL